MNNKQYVNIGLDVVLPQQDIIGIFDMDSVTVQKDSRLFLNKAQVNDEIHNIATDLPITFVVCDDAHKKQRIVFSSFSLPTLYGRMKRKFP